MSKISSSHKRKIEEEVKEPPKISKIAQVIEDVKEIKEVKEMPRMFRSIHIAKCFLD
jgi:uncharacterized Zn finger protein (UPF0148 family)